MERLKQLWSLIVFCLTSPWIRGDARRLIVEDFAARCRREGKEVSKSQFIRYFAEFPEFRSVVYYRVKNRYRLLPKLFLKGQGCCFINSTDIGGGLSLMHGFSTIINARSAGRNLFVFQQVTIGSSRGGTPTIGDNVTICCGAKVIGPVTIGDNVTIGAGSVVLNNVPDNAVVAGNPAKVIGYNTGRRSDFFMD